MKKIIYLILLISNGVWSQNFESWNTINVSGKLNDKSQIAIEGEQRYNITNTYIRYFHFDVGYVRKISEKSKLGFYYRELYELKNNIRVIESRPHIDYFFEYKGFKLRTRAEYQFKQISEDLFRIRFRPYHQSKIFKNLNPYISNEFFFSKYGFVRNRFNMGITICLKKMEIQPSYLMELTNNSNIWSKNNVLWINTKFKF